MYLWTRGCGYESGIAAFVAAAKRYLEAEQLNSSLSLIITGDEEAEAVNIVEMVDWMTETDNVPDFCMVGEPTNPSIMGQTIRNGRRGSLSCERQLQAVRVMSHIGISRIIRYRPCLLCWPLSITELDNGTAYFDFFTAEVTGENRHSANNVIPDRVTAQFNIRFNTEHTVDSLQGWLDEHFGRLAEKLQVSYEAQFWSNALPFITEASDHLKIVRETVERVAGQQPDLSTTGGVRCSVYHEICPVAEFGLVGQTMHQVDEHVRLVDIETLTEIYFQMIRQMDS